VGREKGGRKGRDKSSTGRNVDRGKEKGNRTLRRVVPEGERKLFFIPAFASRYRRKKRAGGLGAEFAERRKGSISRNFLENPKSLARGREGEESFVRIAELRGGKGRGGAAFAAGEERTQRKEGRMSPLFVIGNAEEGRIRWLSILREEGKKGEKERSALMMQEDWSLSGGGRKREKGKRN